jgi:hypothetical protein
LYLHITVRANYVPDIGPAETLSRPSTTGVFILKSFPPDAEREFRKTIVTPASRSSRGDVPSLTDRLSPAPAHREHLICRGSVSLGQSLKYRRQVAASFWWSFGVPRSDWTEEIEIRGKHRVGKTTYGSYLMLRLT